MKSLRMPVSFILSMTTYVRHGRGDSADRRGYPACAPRAPDTFDRVVDAEVDASKPTPSSIIDTRFCDVDVALDGADGDLADRRTPVSASSGHRISMPPFIGSPALRDEQDPVRKSMPTMRMPSTRGMLRVFRRSNRAQGTARGFLDSPAVVQSSWTCSVSSDHSGRVIGRLRLALPLSKSPCATTLASRSATAKMQGEVSEAMAALHAACRKATGDVIRQAARADTGFRPEPVRPGGWRRPWRRGSGAPRSAGNRTGRGNSARNAAGTESRRRS